jgi:hypothetical protein
MATKGVFALFPTFDWDWDVLPTNDVIKCLEHRTTPQKQVSTWLGV